MRSGSPAPSTVGVNYKVMLVPKTQINKGDDIQVTKGLDSDYLIGEDSGPKEGKSLPKQACWECDV